MPSLPVLQPRPPAVRDSRWKPVATRLYRLGVVVAIVWFVHLNGVRARVSGDSPIKLEELNRDAVRRNSQGQDEVIGKALLPAAARLDPDPTEPRGVFVLDAAGNRIGYALRTSPESDRVIGYSGRTDTLVVLGPDMKVLGIRIRSSEDTKEHVFEKVAVNEGFMTAWDGLTWDEVAAREARVGFDDVPGASKSSMGIAEGVQTRFKATKAAIEGGPPPVWQGWATLSPGGLRAAGQALWDQLRFGWHDVALIAVLAVSLLFAFTGLKAHPWVRRAFQVVLIVYVGHFNGQILSQSLMGGWAAGGVPWRTAPALALLLAAALVVPWATRRQVYCSHVCPHGAAQELLGRVSRWKVKVPKGVDRGLRWLPPMLIGLVLAVVMFALPLDPALLEPFVAYQLKSLSPEAIAGIGAAVAILVGGLIVSIFVPMAYCKYGCPTGMVLSYVRSHGKADGFGRKDLAAGLLVAFVAWMYVKHEVIRQWMTG
ncbi:MAG TPA: 4Fe-4S binding protein [Humisphaera sp.]